LIANTSTSAGLKIRAEPDCKSYPTGIKASNEELASLAPERGDFHGEWVIRTYASAYWNGTKS